MVASGELDYSGASVSASRGAGTASVTLDTLQASNLANWECDVSEEDLDDDLCDA